MQSSKINTDPSKISYFSEIKTESKTKKRKVAETGTVSTGGKARSFLAAPRIDSSDANDEDPAREDDVDPLAEDWEASSILGATDVEGQVHFLIKW